jgi:uncharacterized hydrophobic protein (TIGR00271 family)
MGMLSKVIDDFKVTPQDVPRIEATLFYDGPNQRQALERFAVLMFFATLIASYGVIADSTATVIGAMLVAPLMTPVLAVAAAVVTGQMRRAGYSLLIVLGGVVGAIGLAWLIGTFYHSGVISTTSNLQIVSRVSPRLVDLYAALGAGAVGAIASCREDIADTLPGAAIAIALVPPLSVVGLALSQGAWNDASGAMLLFLTNIFAILIAGSAVFALLGLSAAATVELTGHARRRAFELIAVGTLLVAVPLTLASYNALVTVQAEVRAKAAARRWVQDTGFEVLAVTARPNHVLIRIDGSGDLPPIAGIIEALEESLRRETNITLQVVPSQTEEFTISPGG